MSQEIINEMIGRTPELESCADDIRKAGNAIVDCYSKNGKILLCGNGGSSSDADHVVSELMKSFERSRPIPEDLKEGLKAVSGERGATIADGLENGLPAISLSAHAALCSAIANDMDASLIFAQQIVGYGKKGDLLMAISTSGNSQNIVDAVITAKAMGMTVIGLTGQTGGQMKQYCDIAICVPSNSTPEVQEYHLPVYHTICRMVENSLF